MHSCEECFAFAWPLPGYGGRAGQWGGGGAEGGDVTGPRLSAAAVVFMFSGDITQSAVTEPVWSAPLPLAARSLATVVQRCGSAISFS